MKYLSIFILSLHLISCQESVEESETTIPTSDTTEVADDFGDNDFTVSFEFDLFDLKLKEYYDFYPEELKSRGDTISYNQVLGGDDFDSLEIEIHFKENGELYDSVTVEETYHDCVLLSDEGPWTTMEKWKSHSSPVFQAKKLSKNRFLTNNSMNYESSWNPDFTKEELLAGIHEHLDTFWTKIVLEPYCEEWPNCYYSTATYKRCVAIKLYSEGSVTTRVLEVFLPLGC